MNCEIGRLRLSISWNSAGELPPDKLLYDRSRLTGLLRPYFDNSLSLMGVLLAQISVIFSIALTLLTVDIPTRWGITSVQWTSILVAVGVIFTIWWLSVLVKLLRQPSFDRFLSHLISESQTAQDRRFVFLVTAKDLPGVQRVLVEFSDTWKCWLLPSCGKAESTGIVSTAKLAEILAGRLSMAPGEIRVMPIRSNLLSTKFSARHKRLTTYFFDFNLIQFPSMRAHSGLLTRTFVRGETTYSWMSITELRNDPKTATENGDVIDHVEKAILDTPLAVDAFSLKIA